MYLTYTYFKNQLFPIFHSKLISDFTLISSLKIFLDQNVILSLIDINATERPKIYFLRPKLRDLWLTQICSHNQPDHYITIKLSQLKMLQLRSKNKWTILHSSVLSAMSLPLALQRIP